MDFTCGLIVSSLGNATFSMQMIAYIQPFCMAFVPCMMHCIWMCSVENLKLLPKLRNVPLNGLNGFCPFRRQMDVVPCQDFLFRISNFATQSPLEISFQPFLF